MAIPAYIEERIRRMPPEGDLIVPGSTPVVSFGDIRKARVATLAINPSSREFNDRSGNLLEGKRRRLIDTKFLQQIGIDPKSYEATELIFEGCNKYFDGCTALKEWFNKFLPILNSLDVDFYDGSACHLDLVQWATKSAWGNLTRLDRQRLIEDDGAFLEQQIRNENIEILLVNGNTAWDNFKKRFRQNLACRQIECIKGLSRQPCRVYAGTVFERTKVIGWSLNRPSWRAGVLPGFDAEISRVAKDALSRR